MNFDCKRGNAYPMARFVILTLALARAAFSHCDGLDGPVVNAARIALDSNQVERALIWVPASEEKAVKEAFQKTMTVRKMGGEAKDLADRYFFETLVRIHRIAEGAGFEGLKPAGRDLGPAIPAADQALKSGRHEPLASLLERELREGLKKHFQEAHARSRYDRKDVGAGREYVASYVKFIHYVERLHESAVGPAHGHFQDGTSEHAEVEAHR